MIQQMYFHINVSIWVVLTTVSSSRVRLSLTPTTRGVQSGPHEAEPLCRVQDLTVQSRFCLNWIWAWVVAGCRSDRGAVRCQGAVGCVRGVMGWRVVMTVEHVFSQVLVAEGGVTREMIGQRWRLRLNRRQTLALSLRPETQITTNLQNSMMATKHLLFNCHVEHMDGGIKHTVCHFCHKGSLHQNNDRETGRETSGIVSVHNLKVLSEQFHALKQCCMLSNNHVCESSCCKYI